MQAEAISNFCPNESVKELMICILHLWILHFR